jgi:hypothetical protein
MIRLIAVAFVLAISSSAQAMPLTPAQQPNSLVTMDREACGASPRERAALSARSSVVGDPRAEALTPHAGGQSQAPRKQARN